ncbi:hypothetical protein CK500_07455 [Halorubrum salipaludis]|uniref:Uncharacterized protein n=1 Tax=Halorubrum salipaludis TaxID=2032630 RepID=A0A2A2FFP1_9EURY|nr:hypothetical protein [Halorubrum salipaludis]PAU84256.1 hypothetical protein CK500_07455 [Halorubrum salipaludis]
MADLSTLVTGVVLESTKGVAAAEVEAAAERASFRESLDRDPTAFADREAIEAFLRERFPPFGRDPRTVLEPYVDPDLLRKALSRWEPGETAVRPGSPYVHPDRFPAGPLSETPPVERVLGVELTERELEVVGDLALFTRSAVRRVRDAAAERIGRRELAARRSVAEQGYPRPVVEGIDVETKVTFGGEIDATPFDARYAEHAVAGGIGTVRTELHFEDESGP